MPLAEMQPLTELHFIRPLWLLGLLPVVLLLALLWRRRSDQSGWSALIAPQLLQRLMLGRDERSSRAPLVLLGCAWLLAVLSLAGPTWEQQPQAVYQASLDQVVVLDLSPSMAATDVPPDRMTRARFAVSDLMKQTDEGRTALIVFGGEHHVVTPLTDDAATVEQLLRALSVDVLPAAGDRAASALRASMELLTAAKSEVAHVILFSDGISDPADSISAAVRLREAGAKLSVIGISPQRESQLRELARSGGGVYQPLGSRGPHPALEMQAVAEFSQVPGREANADLWVEKGVWLLLPLLFVAAIGYRRGWLAAIVVVAVVQQPREVMAFDWKDLWLTPNQQAKRLLDSGQTQQAAELFDDPGWRAAARYRAGEFDKAAQEFTNAQQAYNRGNALAKAGKLRESIKSYDEALSLRADDADARFNRDLIQKLLDQQQQQQDQQAQQSKDQQDEDKQDKGQQDKSGQDQGQQEQHKNSEGQQGSEKQNQAKQDQKRTDSSQSEDKEQRSSEQRSQQVQSDNGQSNDNQPKANQSKTNDSDAERQDDEHQQAKQDVEQQPQSQLQSSSKSAAGSAAQQRPRPGGAHDNLEQRPPTEKELALQQWLRQVPDDPGGLLRRKFMLEHLQRQKERNSQ